MNHVKHEILQFLTTRIKFHKYTYYLAVPFINGTEQQYFICDLNKITKNKFYQSCLSSKPG